MDKRRWVTAGWQDNHNCRAVAGKRILKKSCCVELNLLSMTTTILSKMRVLLVDDEAIMRKHVSELLRQMGIHQIHEAAEGKTALVEAIRFQPDLVLSDIHMQPMDGIAFVKQLRSLPNPYFAHIPVILMTADTSRETLSEALPLGIKAYIIKPPTLEAMKSRIKAAMG